MKPALSRISRTFAVAFIFATLSAAQPAAENPLRSSSAPTDKAAVAPAADEQVVELSPFEVSTEKDIGYRAATSTSGSRMNEEIKNIPASVSVMTSEFLADIGATDLIEASAYMIGGGYAPSAWIDFRGFNFRGIRAPTTFRNMFSWFSVNDNFSTDRIDIVRGPNSLLFGIAPAGGLVNTTTKRAQFRDFTVTELRLASFAGVRFTADINRRVNEQLAVRLNLLASTQESEQTWQEEQRTGAQLATTWRPFSKTIVRVDAEYLSRPKVNAAPLPRDNFSLWTGNAFTFNSNPAVASGLQRMAANTATTNYYIYNGNLGQFLDWRGFGHTTGPTGNASLPVKDQSIFPREANFGGPDFTLDLTHWTETVAIEQRIGDDLYIELAANEATHRSRNHELFGFATLRRDPNATLPNGAANPHFGDYYYDGIRNRTHIGNTLWEARLSVIYDWKPERWSWMQHKVFASASRRSEEYYSYNWVERLVDNPTSANYSNAANAVRRRIYLSPGDTRQNTSASNLINDPTTGLHSGFVDVASNAARPTARGATLDDSWSISASSSFFNGWLRSLIGQRQDSYTDYNDPVAANATTGIRELKARVRGNRNVATRPFYGLLMSPTKWLTVYGTKAQSFSPATSGLNPFGIPNGIVSGKGEEVGIRLSTPDGRAYFSAVKYEAVTENLRVNVNTALININGIWNDVNVNAVMPGASSKQLTGGTDEGTIAGSDGYELEAFTNLTPAWALTVNYSLTENEQITIPQMTVDYINENLPGWKQLAATYPDVAGSINNRITTLENFVASQIPGVKGVRNYKHNFNVFTRYKFERGPLRNLTVGAGVNYRSGPIQFSEIIPGVGINNGIGESRTLVNCMLSYGKKFRKFRWDATLHVNNLLDHDYFEELSLGNTRYGSPRTIALTNKFTF